MSISSTSINVTSTATLLSTTEADQIPRYTIAVYNGSAATVYVGGSAVTTSNGFPVAASSSVSFDLDRGEQLFGIVTTGTSAVSVIYTGI